jgi:hypothetical protein
MSFAELAQLGDKCVLLIDRDNSQLASFGINASTKTSIEDTTEQLKNCPEDIQIKADVSIASRERDTTAEEIRVSIREIMSRAQNAFGLKSAKYRKFGTSGLARKTDNKLKECAKLVVKVSGQFLGELSAHGLTQAMIDALEALIESFDTKIMTKIEAERSRDLATENRIILGNTLFKQILSVFRFGKTYWASRSEAHYNDYIIYNKKVVKPKSKEKTKK